MSYNSNNQTKTIDREKGDDKRTRKSQKIGHIIATFRANLHKSDLYLRVEIRPAGSGYLGSDPCTVGPKGLIQAQEKCACPFQ